MKGPRLRRGGLSPLGAVGERWGLPQLAALAVVEVVEALGMFLLVEVGLASEEVALEGVELARGSLRALAGVKALWGRK